MGASRSDARQAEQLRAISGAKCVERLPLPFLRPPDDVPEVVGAQALDCDGTVEAIVVRRVDDSHAAFTKLAHDAIPAGCSRATRRCGHASRTYRGPVRTAKAA